MRMIDITLTGGDSATLHNNTRKVSRLWLFPDGVCRLISMSAWHWDTHDRLVTERNDPNFVSDIAFDYAYAEYQKGVASLESLIRAYFNEAIEVSVENRMLETHGIANNNCWTKHPTPMRLTVAGGLSTSFHNARDGLETPLELFR